jgi:membrane protein
MSMNRSDRARPGIVKTNRSETNEAMSSIRPVEHEEDERRPSVTVLGRKVLKEFRSDDVTGIAAEVAYHLIFAVPALIIFLFFLAALIDNVTDVGLANRLSTEIQNNAPEDTRDLLQSLVDNAIGQMSGGLASFGVLAAAVVTVWSGSNATATLMKALNKIYEIDEDRPFVRKRLVALGLTVLLGAAVNLAFVLLVFGQRIGNWLAELIGVGSAFELVWNISRWPVSILLLLTLLAFVYWLAPNVEQSFKWISPGAVIAVVLWIVAVVGFSLYLRFSDPGSAYGSLGSIIVFLFFLYVSSIIFLIGAEVNAVLAIRFDPQTLEDVKSKQIDEPDDWEEVDRERSQGLSPSPSTD